MALLPKQIRFWLFEKLSVTTMRYVTSVPRSRARGLVAEVYDMIAEDFFVNGSLSSRSQVPDLFAGIWTGGRETVLVSDQLDRTTKEALAATLSSINDCPYCGDMLVSLVHSADQHDDAQNLFNQSEEQIADPLLRERLLWVRAVATPGAAPPASVPFTRTQIPEAIGALMAMADINRFSHIVMDGSPVNAPFGLERIKAAGLRLFGGELQTTHVHPLIPGWALHLLPDAVLPEDMQWAASHPRIADAIARWAAAVERQAHGVIPEMAMELVHENLNHWDNERMPISRSWVEDELGGLAGEARNIARLTLLLAKAAYQIDDKLVEDVLGQSRDEPDFIRILAWASFTAARYFANRLARVSERTAVTLPAAAA